MAGGLGIALSLGIPWLISEVMGYHTRGKEFTGNLALQQRMFDVQQGDTRQRAIRGRKEEGSWGRIYASFPPPS